MNIEEFKKIVKTRTPLNNDNILQFMDNMSNKARRITFRLNTAYHNPEEVRTILSE